MNEEVDKKIYELALLVKDEKDVAGVMTLLKQHNGELTAEPRAKKLALAYEIKGETEGIFTSAMFRAAGADAKNLEHDLNTQAGVLRFLIMIAPTTVDRPATYTFDTAKRGGRPMASSSRPSAAPSETTKPAAPRSLSNEALEKKIEEILK